MGYQVLTGIYEEISDERAEQDKQWGVQRHSPVPWVSILVEEIGKAAQAANKLQTLFGRGPEYGEEIERREKAYRRRLITAAAVAIAAIESFDAGARS